MLGRAIRGVRNGPSPKWLQDLLVAIGQRPINALVDVTNLYTYGLGRPLHVFDVAKVRGRTLTMRMAREGESLAALNGKTYALTPEDGIIADESGPEALGGVIGGAPTGCDEGTTEVFIECAIFDPVRIALSGRRHDIRTDARARFERGVDQALPRLGAGAGDLDHPGAVRRRGERGLRGRRRAGLAAAGDAPLRAAGRTSAAPRCRPMRRSASWSASASPSRRGMRPR